MGREVIMKTVIKHARIQFAIGIFGFLAAGGYFVYCITGSNFSSFAMLCLILSILSLVLIGIGVRDLIFPEKSFAIKSNPEIFDMADEHFANIRYKDECLTISDRMISITDNPATVSYMNEVLLVYIEKDRTNFVTTGKSIVIETARGIHRMNALAFSDRQIEEKVFSLIARYCHNAVIGHSSQNKAYAERMRNTWKQNRKG